jgi:hypothetical protein
MKRLTRRLVCEGLERRDLLNADWGCDGCLDTQEPLDEDMSVLVESTAPFGTNSANRPFKGSVTGEATFVPGTNCPNFGGLRTDSAATGTASHLGRVSMTGQHCTPPPGQEITGGEMTLVAANGDELYFEYSATGGPLPMPGEVIVIDTDFEITGGTGRFEGAQGGGDMTAYVVFAPLEPAWPGTWVWEGTIGYGNSRHMKDSAIAAALLSSEDNTPPRGQGLGR